MTKPLIIYMNIYVILVSEMKRMMLFIPKTIKNYTGSEILS